MIIFKRLSLITPPRKFMYQPQIEVPQNLSLKCTKIIVNTMKAQSTYQTLNQIEDIIDQNPKIAELYFFCSEINLALLKYENAKSILEQGLKAHAEPQELLRDGLTMFQSIEKVLYPQTKIKPIILRKAPHDYYKLNYKINNKLMEELLSLAQFKLGGELLFDKNQSEQNKTEEISKDQIVQQIKQSQNSQQSSQQVKQNNQENKQQNQDKIIDAYQQICEEDSGCNYL